MHERRIPASRLGRARFAVSPLWETVASLRVLASAGPRLHAPWVAQARRAVQDARLDFGLLLALVPPRGHLADVLTPPPPRRRNTFAVELRRIAQADPDAVRHDLRLLQEQAGHGIPALSGGEHDPTALLRRAIADLEAYWRSAVEPHWPRLRALAEADIAARADTMTQAGAHGMFAGLHPRISLAGNDIVVQSTCGGGVVPGEGGVVLVPCAFAWPEVLLYAVPGHPCTVTYAPRGIGELWTAAPERDGDPLGELLGPTRAMALRLLDLPLTTTQVAEHLGVGAPGANAHLKVLARTGLASARRSGRLVHYSRTPLGDRLTKESQR